MTRELDDAIRRIATVQRALAAFDTATLNQGGSYDYDRGENLASLVAEVMDSWLVLERLTGAAAKRPVA